MSISKEELNFLYTTKEYSMRTIAKKKNLSKTTIEYYLKKYKIPRRTNQEINKKNNYRKQAWTRGLSKETDSRILKMSITSSKTAIKKRNEKIKLLEKKMNCDFTDLLIDLYWNKGYSLEKISKIIGFDRVLVSKFLSQDHIKKRPRWYKISKLSGKDHSQYGKTWEDVRGKKKAEEHKRIVSKATRKSILKRISKNEIPFSDTIIERIVELELKKKKIAYQKQIKLLDRFVCDFFLPDYKLVIECDGDYWHANPFFYNRNKLTKTQQKNLNRDKFKDRLLKKNGFSILRFYEYDIKNNLSLCMKKLEEKVE